MLNRRGFLTIAGVSVLSATSKSESGSDGQVQQPKHADLRIACPLSYLVYLPKGYTEQQTQRWPLMLFLHGAGERGSDLDRVKANGPPKLIEQGWHFPFIVISPQCAEDGWWNALTLEALLEQVQRDYRVDLTRVYLSGLSMGGFGTWDLASRHPQRYAAIVPICGRGEPLMAYQLRDLPIWAFHGAKDQTVPLRYSQDMIDAIQSVGGKPRLTVYPHAAHDSWTETYANEKLYAWLLKQRTRA